MDLTHSCRNLFKTGHNLTETCHNLTKNLHRTLGVLAVLFARIKTRAEEIRAAEISQSAVRSDVAGGAVASPDDVLLETPQVLFHSI